MLGWRAIFLFLEYTIISALCLRQLITRAAAAPAPYKRPSAAATLELDHPLLIRAPGSPHQPEQLHLALSLSPGAVAVSWVTHPQEDTQLTRHKHHKHPDPACTHLEGVRVQSIVQYSTQTGNLVQNATGNFTCYAADAYESGALHRVLLGLGQGGPLPPDTTIFYKVGDPELGMSQEFNFTTQPVTGQQALPYRLGLMGDVGQTADSKATLQHLVASAPQSILDVGDISYADGFQPRWDSYGRLAETLSASVPVMHIEGNHEIEVTNGHLGFLAYEARFYAPYKQSKSHTPLFYSYEVGPAHIIMLGSYAPYGRHSKQYAWLERDLAGVDRARTPWLLVGMHAPWYNSNTAHQGEVDDMRDSMEGLLYQHGVDAVFTGHVHAYERVSRVRSMNRDACGPVHICIGDGGNREGLALDYLPRPPWSEFREPSFGSGMLLLQNATHAFWEWRRNQDALPVVSDATWIVRNTAADCAAARLQQARELVQQAEGPALQLPGLSSELSATS